MTNTTNTAATKTETKTENQNPKPNPVPVTTAAVAVAPAPDTKESIKGMTPEAVIAKFGNGNKSACIRYLTATKLFSTGEIGKIMNIRYQFVRNVQTAPVSTKK
jgi:hypothetical protein